MRRTELLLEIRKMRLEQASDGWDSDCLTQSEATALLGVGERTFRRYLARYELSGVEGLFSRVYSDWGSPYWHSPKAGGKVNKRNLTQVGQAMQRLGIEMIPA